MMVRIVWTDSGTFRENGWETKEQIAEGALSDIVTVGELVHEEEDRYYVALSSDFRNDHYYGTQVIGKFAVREFSCLVQEPMPSQVAKPQKSEEAWNAWRGRTS